jgi:hypothetical protein
MRAVLPFALVLAFAIPVEAQQQQQVQEETVQAVQQLDGPRAPERAPVLRTPKVPVQAAPADDTNDGAPVVQNELQTRAVEAMDARQGTPALASWWWLVAAMVVAGLIIIAIT